MKQTLKQRIKHCCQRWGQKQIVKRISKRLALNDEQQNHMVSLSEQFNETRGFLKEQKSQVQFELLTLLDKENLEQQDAEQLMTKHLDELTHNTRSLLASFTQFFNQLDEKQKETLRNQLQQHHCCCN